MIRKFLKVKQKTIKALFNRTSVNKKILDIKPHNRQFIVAAAPRETAAVWGSCRLAAAERRARTAQMVVAAGTRPAQVPGRWLEFWPGCMAYRCPLLMIIHIPGIINPYII